MKDYHKTTDFAVVFDDNIPTELRQLPQWVLWRYETRGGKPTKVPKQTNGSAASSTEERTWTTFEDALAAARNKTGYGIGLAGMERTRYTGIDLDGCLDPDTGEITPEARKIIDALDSYTEQTPGLDGLRIWVEADKAPTWTTNKNQEDRKTDIEIYSSGRFFTVTGRHLPGTPETIESRQGELDAFMQEYAPPAAERRVKEPYEGDGHVLDLDRFLEEFGVTILGSRQDRTSDLAYTIVCPWVHEHTDEETSGTRVGQYDNGALWFKCDHAHCLNRKWEDFREELDPEAYQNVKIKVTGSKKLSEEEKGARADAAWETCAELASRSDITQDFANTLHDKGVAGESNQIRLLYLAVNSRRLGKPVNVAVKGASSSGKSYLVEQVLGGFPDSAYYALSAMSEKALIYLDEDMRHRFLVIYEASGMAGDMQTYLIRTLLSEGKIRYQTAEATAKGVKPRLLEMEGPTGLIVTTTQTKMHPENETRLFSLLVTDSREQTADILMAMADEDREPVSMDEWRALQTWLEGQPGEVYIPYSKQLAKLIPPVAVRLRRDFMAVLQLIRSHALLHQHTRERDEKGRILANFEDYAVVRELVAPLVAEGVDATVPQTVRETVEMVGELTEDKPHVTLRELANALELDKSSTSRRWQHARDAGYLKNLEDSKGRPARICLGDPLPEEVDVLPTLDDLERCCTVAGVSGGRHTPYEDCTGANGDNKAAISDTTSVEDDENSAKVSENGNGTGEGVYLPPNNGATVQHPPFGGTAAGHEQAILGILERKYAGNRAHPDGLERRCIEFGMPREQYKRAIIALEKSGRVGFHIADTHKDSYYYLPTETIK